MPLPVSSLPPELPSASTRSASAPGLARSDSAPSAAAFADVLSGAANPSTPAAPGAADPARDAAPASEDANTPGSVTYSSSAYIALVAAPQAALMIETAPAAPAADAEADDADLSDPTAEDDKRTSTDETAFLQYQLVAGQWVLQPPPAPEQSASPDSLLEDGAQSGKPAAGAVAGGLSPSGRSALDDAATAPASRFPVYGAPADSRLAANSAATNQDQSRTMPAEVAAPQGDEKTAPALEAALGTASTAAISPAAATSADDSASTPPVDASKPALAASAPQIGAESGRGMRATEKFAATRSDRDRNDAPGGISSDSTGEKKSLLAKGKRLMNSDLSSGTTVANREKTMPFSAATKSSLADLSATSGVAQAAVKSAEFAVAVPPTSGIAPAHASQLVREIRDIGERVSSIERNSVEVRFDFSDTEKLAVKVQYRDGVVQTTFRTDSSLLRDAISQAWSSQPPANEQRSYRMEQPSFVSADAGQQDLSSGRDGSGQARAQEQSPHSGGLHSSFAGRSSSQTAAAPSSAAASKPLPDRSRLLHTFA